MQARRLFGHPQGVIYGDLGVASLKLFVYGDAVVADQRDACDSEQRTDGKRLRPERGAAQQG